MANREGLVKGGLKQNFNNGYKRAGSAQKRY